MKWVNWVKWRRLVMFDSATPWTAAYQAPPPMGCSRQEYWSGLPFPSQLINACKILTVIPSTRPAFGEYCRWWSQSDDNDKDVEEENLWRFQTIEVYSFSICTFSFNNIFTHTHAHRHTHAHANIQIADMWNKQYVKSLGIKTNATAKTDTSLAVWNL